MNYDEIAIIRNRLDELEKLIKGTRGRLPAHSVKPPVMMELLEYEDEYDELLEKFIALEKKRRLG